MGLSFSQYFPSITKTLGFNTTITLLLTFPPWAFATVFALANAWHSDRTGEKYFHIALGYAFAILGYIIALTSKWTRYSSCVPTRSPPPHSQDHGRKVHLPVRNVHGLQRHVLFTSHQTSRLIFNTFPGGIILLGWVSTSVPRPPVKRAAAIAIVNGFANIGQIPASYLWPSKWAPKYWRSFTTELCLLAFSLAIGLGPFPIIKLMNIANRRSAYRQYLVYLNEQLNKGEAEAFKTDEKTLATSAKCVASPIFTHYFIDLMCQLG